MKISKFKTVCALLLVGVLVTRCSIIRLFAVSIEYSLSECPEVSFDFPERLRVENSMLLATESYEYCHNFTHFEVFSTPSTTPYFEISGDPIGKLFAKIKREKSGCKLEFIFKKQCRVNQSAKACEDAAQANESDFLDLVQLASKSLFFKKNLKIIKMDHLEILHTNHDLEKWCSKYAKENDIKF
jgi:hypothetical protein